MLSDRPELSLAAQCFLWYAKAFWTRATGGAQGVTHYRHGGMDDRAELVSWIAVQMTEHSSPFLMLLHEHSAAWFSTLTVTGAG